MIDLDLLKNVALFPKKQVGFDLEIAQVKLFMSVLSVFEENLPL